MSHLASTLSWRLLTASGLWLLGSAILADDGAGTEIEYNVTQISAEAGGVFAYVPENWGDLHVHLINRQDHPVELLCVTYFDSEPTLQYGRRIWIPASARIRATHPVRVPDIPDESNTDVGFHTMVSRIEENRVQIVSGDELGKMQFQGALRVIRHRPVSGIVLRPRDNEEGIPSGVSPFNLVMTGRLDRGLSRHLVTLGDRILPGHEEGLRALDQLVLADDRMLGDAAALSAIRRWLHDGGRLWLMLDRVSPDLLDVLIGDESGCRVIDSVTLTHVKIGPAPDGPPIGETELESEHPIKLVRVIVDDEEVPFFVDGWPAAFRKNCGAGQLLVTTLESTGWVRSRSELSSRPARREDDTTEFVATVPFQHLMDGFFTARPDLRTLTEALEAQAQEYVGYSIPSRSAVSVVLGLFVAILVGLSVRLARVGRLERLAAVSPALALLAAGSLALMGWKQQQAIPATTALLQVLTPIAGTDDVSIAGSAALYSSDTGPAVVEGHSGGWLMPQLGGTGGTIRQMIWSDLDTWRWDNLHLPPGLRTATFHACVFSPQRASARAELGPSGLVGQLSIPTGLRPTDAVLVTEAGRIGVDMREDGSFEAQSDRVLTSEQYLQADLLSDDQTRRSRMLATFLPHADHFRSQALTLFVWTDPWDAGFRFREGARQVGTALVGIPLELQRPAAGTTLSLSAPMLPYREVRGPDGLAPSGLYDGRHRSWTSKSWPSATWLRFQVPPVLLPIQPRFVRIVVRVTGPVGRLALSGAHTGRVFPLQTWIDPVGTVSVEIEGEELPPFDAQGGWLLRVDGGDPDRPELTDPDPEGTGQRHSWQIESLSLEMQAVVQEVNSAGASPLLESRNGSQGNPDE